MRQIVDLNKLCEILPLTQNQAYKLCRVKNHPLPYKKCGKKLWFDMEKVFRWFDALPGRDQTLL